MGVCNAGFVTRRTETLTFLIWGQSGCLAE